MAVPGEGDCREVAPCGDDPWGDVPVEPTTVYVDGAYAGGGSDGTPERPWQTIQAGIDAAAPGAMVAVAAGSYPEDLLIDGKAVRLWGRCPALVEISGTGSEIAAVMVFQGADNTEIRGLGITGPQIGVVVSGSQQVTIEDVWVHATGWRGVDVEGQLGTTSALVRGSLIEQAGGSGGFVGGAHVEIDRTVVRGTVPDADGLAGGAVHIMHRPDIVDPTVVAIGGVVLEDNVSEGLFVAASQVTVAASVIRDTHLDPTGQGGRGINIQGGVDDTERASATVLGTAIERAHEGGICVSGADVTVESTTIRDTQVSTIGIGGRGISVQDDSARGGRSIVSVRTSLIEQCRKVALLVAGSDALIESTVIRDTAGDDGGQFGVGMQVQSNLASGERATVTMRGSLLERNRYVGMSVFGADTVVESTAVRETYPVGGLFGDAVAALAHGESALLTLLNDHVEGSERAGVLNEASTVVIGATRIACVAFELNGEPSPTHPDLLFVFDDLGGNACGCGQTEWPCTVVSASLQPPGPAGGP